MEDRIYNWDEPHFRLFIRVYEPLIYTFVCFLGLLLWDNVSAGEERVQYVLVFPHLDAKYQATQMMLS